MPPVLPVLRVGGPGRNVGKTWLARHLIEAFTRRGYAVGAIKRSHHPLPPDKPGSDTDLFMQAGAVSVTLGAAEGSLIRHRPVCSLAELVEEYAGRADLVIVEGFKEDQLGALAWIERPACDGDPGRVVLRSVDGDVFLDAAVGDIAAIVAACEARFELSSAGTLGLRRLLRVAALAHGTRCEGAVLGVRLAMAGMVALGLPCPPPARRLSATVHAAHCAVDAVAAATGCSIGTRSLSVIDAGELAVDFVDHVTARRVRVAVREAVAAPLDACGGVGPRTDRRRTLDLEYRTQPDETLFVVTGPTSPTGGRPVRRSSEESD